MHLYDQLHPADATAAEAAAAMGNIFITSWLAFGSISIGAPFPVQLVHL